MKVVMNDLRKAILKVLESADKPLTLAEISEKVGAKVSSGTTNPLVTENYMVATDLEIEYDKVRKDTGAVIGVGHTKVKAYTLGTTKAE